jgi:DNA invertase Pin-like site-specific DNA recombinase
VLALSELTDLGFGSVCLTKALDFTAPTGHAMEAMLAVFAEFEREVLRDRFRAEIAHTRREGRPHGRPRTALLKADKVRRLKAEQASHSEIARRLGIRRSRCGASSPQPEKGRRSHGWLNS